MKTKIKVPVQALEDAQRYTYRTGWSAEDEAFVARVLEFPSLAAHGKDSLAAHGELLRVVVEVLDDMKNTGEAIPEPLGMRSFKGKVPLRISPDLHRQLAIEAEEQGISLNQFLATKLLR